MDFNAIKALVYLYQGCTDPELRAEAERLEPLLPDMARVVIPFRRPEKQYALHWRTAFNATSLAKQLPDGRMRPAAAAQYLGYSLQTLSGWRSNGSGPAYSKIGRSIFYRQEELDRFIREGK